MPVQAADTTHYKSYMMKKHYLAKASLLALTGWLAVASCKKDGSSAQATDEQKTINLAASAIASETVFDDAFSAVLQGSEQGGVTIFSVSAPAERQGISFAASVPAPVVTVTPSGKDVYPKTVTIDYGSGITSANGITRKGKIIALLSGKLRTPGTLVTVNFDGYAVNGYTVAGTYLVTPSISSAGVSFKVAVTNGSITFPNGQVNTYSGTETVVQTGGLTTATVADDVYAVTGSFTYSNSNGENITGTITKALVKSFDCKNITSGTIAFVYNNTKNGVLDFGSGTCDNQATVTSGATIKIITLP